MVKHILFPTDGSKSSRNAIAHVIDFAQRFEAEVTLLHSYEFYLQHQVLSRYGTDASIIEDVEEQMKHSGVALLKETAEMLTQAGIVVKQQINQQGEAGQSIVDTAKQQACDVIIMGTRGMGMIKSALLGSVSHYVLNHLKIPVYLIPFKEEA